MPHQLTALYNRPEDPAAFDRYYDEVHTPLAAKLPGLRSFLVNRPGPDADGNPPPYHLIAVLTFDSAEAFGAALNGPEGKAAVADLPNFAGAGVTILNGPAEAVV
ncbi:EthD family reductase [Pseudonocardia asaccharolytica]|uniref:EthD domain-containing protein n=1 Tax=Pseudonocardia asaccharolytica DSM 44247 = NBRC 16224 TaxID=1123024 RepID=A0A511D2S8_9PSEU|nr:EthD family reductase [Pseudonocardia asaccharolytica]GEL19089.1 hypothetical protein PA7_29260 [Pseudonocardia asaccharolytica DSM 44247 = NBRC 16224]